MLTLEEAYEKGLPKFSYSKLDKYVQCPMNYKHKYVDGNYVTSDAIHLDLGNIAHKVLEIKYRNTIDGVENDYDNLINIFKVGIAEDTDKDKGKMLLGLRAIKDKYGEEALLELNKKSELSYADKIRTFYNYIKNDKLEDDWKPLAVEVNFEFVYEDRCIIHGFIDRVDINNDGEIRVVDYKSSNKIYEDKDLKTPLQMMIYTLACEQLYGKTPIMHMYDMIFLDVKQLACSKGYYKRGVKKLNGILDSIEESERTGIYKPKPTPLCHWCDFSETNDFAPFYTKDLCEYYSLWLPNKKSFKVNKEFENGIKEEDLEF